MAAMTKPEVEEVPDHVLSAKEKNDLQEEATNKQEETKIEKKWNSQITSMEQQIKDLEKKMDNKDK